jgi:hypothetical protein
MIMIIFFCSIDDTLMNFFFIFLVKNSIFDADRDDISSLSLKIVNMGEGFLKSSLFVVIYFAFSKLKMLLQNLYVDVLYLFISQILNVLL